MVLSLSTHPVEGYDRVRFLLVNEKREGRRLLLAGFPGGNNESKEYYSGIIRVGADPRSTMPQRCLHELAVDLVDWRNVIKLYLFCELCQSNKHEMRSGRFAAGHSCANLAGFGVPINNLCVNNVRLYRGCDFTALPYLTSKQPNGATLVHTQGQKFQGVVVPRGCKVTLYGGASEVAERGFLPSRNEDNFAVIVKGTSKGKRVCLDHTMNEIAALQIENMADESDVLTTFQHFERYQALRQGCHWVARLTSMYALKRGPPGPRGEKGEEGKQGPPGIQGQGERGETGAKVYKDSKGSQVRKARVPGETWVMQSWRNVP